MLKLETPILWPPDSFEKILILGKTDAKAETPIFWPPDAKN